MSGPSDKAAERLARLPYSDDEWFALFPRERNELHDKAAAELGYDDGYKDAVRDVVEALRDDARLFAVTFVKREFGSGS